MKEQKEQSRFVVSVEPLELRVTWEDGNKFKGDVGRSVQVHEDPERRPLFDKNVWKVFAVPLIFFRFPIPKPMYERRLTKAVRRAHDFKKILEG